MTNEEFLAMQKKYNNNISDIYIINNSLVWNNYSVILDNLSLEKISSYCPVLFSLEPLDIIKVIYTCKLLSKSTLTNQEKEYLINYTKSYLFIKKHLLNNIEYKVNDKIIDNSILERDIKGIELPILFSDDDAFKNSLGAQIIKKELDKYYEEMNIGGIDYSLQRVRKKNNIPASDPSIDMNYLEYEEFHNKLNNIQNAGFVTIFLLGFTIVTTIIILMMIK